MELAAFIVGLCLIGILAMRFGYDSRSAPYSKEHEMAGYGVRWEVHPRHRSATPGLSTSRLEDLRREAEQWRLAREATASSTMRLRLQLAQALRVLARWLSPDVVPPRSASQATQPTR